MIRSYIQNYVHYMPNITCRTFSLSLSSNSHTIYTHAHSVPHACKYTQATWLTRVALNYSRFIQRLQALVNSWFVFSLSFFTSISLEYSFFFFFLGVRITACRENFRFSDSRLPRSPTFEFTLLLRWINRIGIDIESFDISRDHLLLHICARIYKWLRNSRNYYSNLK